MRRLPVVLFVVVFSHGCGEKIAPPSSPLATASPTAPPSAAPAEHRVPGGTLTIGWGEAGEKIEGACDIDAAYAEGGDVTADWALCLLKKRISGTLYESINSDPQLVRSGTKLRLLGFGCTGAG